MWIVKKMTLDLLGKNRVWILVIPRKIPRVTFLKSKTPKIGKMNSPVEMQQEILRKMLLVRKIFEDD